MNSVKNKSNFLDYSKIPVKEILEYYGLRNVRNYDEEINFSCPFPEHKHGDRNPSSYVNTKTGQWHCFSCGRSGSFINFISEYEGITYSDAQHKIISKASNNVFKSKSLTQALEDAVKPKIPPKSINIPEQALSQFYVDWDRAYEAYEKGELPKKLGYMFGRGFNAETLDYYQIGYDTHTNRVTIPVRDENERLVGFKGRAPTKYYKPKYLAIGDRSDQGVYYGFPYYKKADYVWGLDSAPSDLIICEGELDALSLRQKGYEGSVAIGGSEPSEKQIDAIVRNATSVILMLDPDKSGQKARGKLEEKLLQFIPVKIAELSDKDPADSSKEEIAHALQHSKSTFNIS